MAELKTSDFYYGAILSHFVNNGICPVLLEAGKDRQLYEFMTDNRDFVLFAKYRSKTTTSKEDYISWFGK